MSFLGIALAATIVFRGALTYFFSQDDFWWIAQARGLMPWQTGAWRFLSYDLFFRFMNAAAGLRPAAYHLASLGLHATAASLLFLVLRRRVRTPAAWTGAIFFATHPVPYTALYWVSANADVMALACALGAILLFATRGARRWLALPLVLAAFLSKESTLLLPLWLVLFQTPVDELPGRAWQERLGRRVRDPLSIVLMAGMCGFAIYLAAADVFNARHAGAHQAYAVSWDGTIVRNLFNYLGWSANFAIFTVQSFADAPESGAFGWGVALAASWGLGLLSRRLRARGWVPAGGLYLTLLAPVLPLGHHVYHYYLYAPLAGAAWCLAAVFDAYLDRRGAARASAARVTGRTHPPSRARSGDPVPARRGTWALAVGIAVALVANGVALVHKIEIFPFIAPQLRADPTVDRARIAGNVVHDLAGASLPDGASLFLWFPRTLAPGAPGAGGPGGETYWEQNVRSAIADGLAIRIFYPRLAEVRFVQDVPPPRASDRYAVYQLDGHLRVVTASALDSLIRIMPRTPSM